MACIYCHQGVQYAGKSMLLGTRAFLAVRFIARDMKCSGNMALCITINIWNNGRNETRNES